MSVSPDLQVWFVKFFCMYVVNAINDQILNTAKNSFSVSDVCQRFLHDEEILLLALGGIQNLVWGPSESYINRCRLADTDGLIILSQIYDTSSNETIKARCLEAIKNLLGNSM